MNDKKKNATKKILVTRATLPPMEEYIEEIASLWESHHITNMGKKHNLLEEKLKEYLRVDQLSLMVNGHMALEMALQAFNLRGEVITTPFTFASTTHAIVRNNLTPVFCDINKDDFTLDVSQLENLITDRTSAILPVHVYGNICDVDEIDRLAKKYGLKVLYDAAHTFGEFYRDRGIGSFGDASAFSFHATKVYNTIEGGAVSFKVPEMYVDLYRLKNFGIRGPENVDWVGGNAKMNEFQAAMGLCNLRHVEEHIAKRKIVSERYRDNLENIAGIQLNIVQKDLVPNYAYVPIVVDESIFGSSRNEIFQALAAEGIGARKYFYPITNSYNCFYNKYDSNATPTALYISKRVLTLPIYGDLDLKEVDRICRIIIQLKKAV